MNAIAPFPRWLSDYQPDEPAYALMHRTLELFPEASPAVFYSEMGHRGGGLGALDPSKVAFICNQEEELVLASTPIGDRKHQVIQGQKIGYKQWSTRHRKWCPACLRKQAYHRFAWDVHAVTACAEHGVRLRTRCECGARVDWRSSKIVVCRCGSRLDRQTAVNAEASEVAAASFLSARLGNGPEINELLDGVEFWHAIQITETLGQISLDEALTKKEVIAQFGYPALISAGYLVLSNFPENFRAMLDRLYEKRDARAAVWGLEKIYGGLRNWLVKNLPRNGRLLSALHDEMIAHASDKIALSKALTDSNGDRISVDRFTHNEAAEICGVSHKRVRLAAERLDLLPPESRSGRPVELSRSDIDAISSYIRTPIGIMELAAQLGITKGAVHRLVRSGVVKTLAEELRGDFAEQRSHSHLQFAEGTDEQLFRQLEAHTKPSLKIDLAPLPDASQSVRCSTAKAISFILEGRLSIVEIDETQAGLRRYLVSRSEVRTADANSDARGIGLHEAGRRLGLKPEMARQMRERGHIKVAVSTHGYIVSENEFQRLSGKFIVSSEISRKYNVSKQGRAVSVLLASFGVEPFIGRPEYQQNLYKRADIERALHTYEPASLSPDEAPAVPLLLKDARPILGINSGRFAAALIRDGYLGAPKDGKCKYVQPDEIERFNRTYVSVVKLVERTQAGRSHQIIALLRSEGIEPVCTLATHSGILYRLEDVSGSSLGRRFDVAR
jgi:hypothetical protein